MDAIDVGKLLKILGYRMAHIDLPSQAMAHPRVESQKALVVMAGM